MCIAIVLGCVNDISYFNNEIHAIHDYGTDIEIEYYCDNKLEFKLIAEEVKQFSNPVKKSLFPKGIKVFIYNESLDTMATIFADFALQNKEIKLVEVRRNVILTNINNEQLNTELLFWDKERKEIYTDDFVTIKTDNEIIMGYGFLTDEKFSTYSLSNITGTIYL